ncbi:c-type cytochrome [Tropicimonas marinistellae]|uniref:c-type cytochrome n=1 Tax=Tropicimonas marinistellae TaxID=1739787 RepID=UPI001F35BDE0|nr:cytochrome c [Tropicimonas marinistellae]
MSQSNSLSISNSDEQDPSGGDAPMVDVRLPEGLSADATLGKTVYDEKCVSCHGTNAAGQWGIAPPLVHKIYKPSHHGDMAFQLAARTGVRAHHWSFGSMPPVEDISDTEITQVTLYIRELQRENGIQ